MKTPVRIPPKCFKTARAVKRGLSYTLLCQRSQSHDHQCYDADHDAWFVPQNR